jgi:hypothetical protein
MSTVLIFEILALDIHNELLAVSLWRLKGSELPIGLYDIIALPHTSTYSIYSNYDCQSTGDLIFFPAVLNH